MATVLIKKYGNRRLYDTSDSRYVTLDELAAKIRTGADLRIVDAQIGSGANLGGELVERDVPAVARIVEPPIAVLLDQDRSHEGTLEAGSLHCKQAFCCTAKDRLTATGAARSVRA